MRSRRHSAPQGAGVILLMTAMFCITTPSDAAPAPQASPTLLSEVVADRATQLAAIDSNAGAMALFTSTIGPALGLNDTAGMLSAKGLPATLAKELGVAELSQSAHELMAALAAWQLGDSIYRATEETWVVSIAAATASTTRHEWINATSRLPAFSELFRLLAEQLSPDSAPSASPTSRMELLLAAHRLAFEAHQAAIASWWSLHEWKDRVRQARGLARLCGTWQWTIHNHQHHQEQKTVMLFPPAGHQPPNIPLPTETVVLGDSIYLRWERSGHVEEDSLLFVTDGHKKDGHNDTLRIEGSFVNNTGGWGSIVGKRTADCRP
jgi:hypothetical protein